MKIKFHTIFDGLPASATVCLCLILAGTGCASDTSFDRHNLSRVWLSEDGNQIYFDATVTTAYPADSEDAETVRMSWVAEWLKIRKYCINGHRVSERRTIRSDEYNPQRHNYRYTVECTE